MFLFDYRNPLLTAKNSGRQRVFEDRKIYILSGCRRQCATAVQLAGIPGTLQDHGLYRGGGLLQGQRIVPLRS